MSQADMLDAVAGDYPAVLSRRDGHGTQKQFAAALRTVLTRRKLTAIGPFGLARARRAAQATAAPAGSSGAPPVPVVVEPAPVSVPVEQGEHAQQPASDHAPSAGQSPA